VENPDPFFSTELVEYLLDHSNGETRQKIDQARKANPTLQALLDLLESCKQSSPLGRELLDPEYVPLRIVEKRELVMRLYSGDLGSEDSRLLLNELNSSASTLLDDLMVDMAPTPEASIPITERVPILAWLFRKPKVLSKRDVLATVVSPSQQPAVREFEHAKFSEKLERVFRLQGGIAPKLGFAMAAVVLIFGAYAGVRYYQTSYKISQAASLLKDHYRVFFENTPRLSGDYGSTGILALMDADEPESTYLERALRLIEQAVQSGATAPQAKQLSAQIFYIEKEYSRTDSVLRSLSVEERKAAPVLNDLGVLSFAKADWQTANSYFEAAIEADPNFKEAYYNAALAQTKLGNKNDARAKLQIFMELETDEGWINAARQFMKNLSEGED
jgi:tetratricopeptide (TPR) repeat protein